MKKTDLIYLILAICLSGLTTSCEDMYGDFLEKAPGSDITEDTIFSSMAQVQIFLASCYEQSLFNPWNETTYRYGGGSYDPTHTDDNISIWSCISDEAKHQIGWFNSNKINVGNVNTSSAFYDPFVNHRWTAMRMVHTLLERIDDVPDADNAFKTQIKAEARHLRAEINFENFKRYGGIPLVDRRFKPDEINEMKVPRSSVDSTIQFIVQDLDYAASILPDTYPSNMRGRITKGASLSLKSRVLLYAASPLYNTDAPPLSMSDPANNRLICYGTYDVSRWQKAADAAKAVLDWASSAGVHLITDQGVDKNYRYVWEINDNAEIILANKHADKDHRAPSPGNPIRYWLDRSLGGLQGVQPTHSFVESMYDKRDGTSQSWPDEADNLSEKYAELDYRLGQTIGYNGMYWNQARGNLAIYRGPGRVGPQSVGNITGYVIKKWIPDYVTGGGTPVDIDFFRYRLAEFYLNYAESLNEVKGAVPEAYNAVNTVRARSGMPPLPLGLTKEEFRERVRKERGIELAYENHRWWDLRRWRMSEQVLNGPFYGLKIYKNQPETDPLTFRYEKYVFEQRVFTPNMYHYFFPVKEINLGYIVQNPGW